jgi:hypothetical protein
MYKSNFLISPTSCELKANSWSIMVTFTDFTIIILIVFSLNLNYTWLPLIYHFNINLLRWTSVFNRLTHITLRYHLLTFLYLFIYILNVWILFFLIIDIYFLSDLINFSFFNFSFLKRRNLSQRIHLLFSECFRMFPFLCSVD